jgi:tRNA pseudouridine55 synthase
MDGVVAIDKPSGMTSHDVVAEVRRRLGTKKVGHGGTLDPDATGVLVVGVGRATRFLSYLQSAPKRYRAVARFGVSTTTQDASGEVVETRPARLERAQVEAELSALTGTIDQVPPMVSAVKVGGERLYRKARRGEEVERQTRRVTVHRLELLDLAAGEGPEATLDVVCSGGTYVRTLVHDLGERLGCGAHLASLRRTEAGGWSENDLVALAQVDAGCLRPLAETVRQLPSIEVRDAEARAVADGRPLDARPFTALAPAEAALHDGAQVAVTTEGRLLAVYRRAGDRLVADRVVPRPDG